MGVQAPRHRGRQMSEDRNTATPIVSSSAVATMSGIATPSARPRSRLRGTRGVMITPSFEDEVPTERTSPPSTGRTRCVMPSESFPPVPVVTGKPSPRSAQRPARLSAPDTVPIPFSMVCQPPLSAIAPASSTPRQGQVLGVRMPSILQQQEKEEAPFFPLPGNPRHLEFRRTPSKKSIAKLHPL